MPTAVVAGGAGFVGSYLCESLLSRGVRVVAVDDDSTGRAANIAHLLGDDRFSLVEADVWEPFDLPSPVDLVLHFASPASPPDYLRLPLETLRVGSVGTVNLLELARRHGARSLLASTSESYGDPLVHPPREAYWGNANPVELSVLQLAELVRELVGSDSDATFVLVRRTTRASAGPTSRSRAPRWEGSRGSTYATACAAPSPTSAAYFRAELDLPQRSTSPAQHLLDLRDAGDVDAFAADAVERVS